MGIFAWWGQNWFFLLQSLGIIGGLLFTASALRIDAKVRRIGNLITITAHHRRLWSQLYSRAELLRLLDPKADLKRKPITAEEELFMMLLLVHLSTARHAMLDDMLVTPEGLRKDIHWFFSLPIPKAVWDKVKSRHDRDFVAFVEDCRESC